MLSSTDSIALQSSASVNSHLSKSSLMHDRSRLENTSLGQEQQRHSSPHGSSSNGHRSLLSPLTLRGMNDPIQRQNSAPLTPSLDMLKERRTASPFDPNLLDLSSSLRELKVSLNPSQKPSLLSDTIRMHHSQPSSPMPQPTPDRNVTPLYLPDARMQSSQTSHVTNQSTHANSQYHGNSSHTPGNMSSGHVHDTKPKGEPSACIFVASLNATRTDEQLRESVLSQFSQFGSIIDIKVMRDSQGRPFAFVQYDSPENAKRALIQGHQKVLDGRPVRVEQARVNRTLFVTKYDRNLSEQQLRGELDSFGQIEELKFLRNAVSGRSKGCCFVRYHFREDAIRAFNGVRSKYHWGAEWTENLEKRESQVEPFEIFVGQLDPLLVTEQDLFNRFKKYGYIQRVQLIRRNYPGRAIRPSFAFITFTTTDAAEKAIEEENGQEWNNRPLKVTHRELYTDEHHGDGGGDAQQQEAAASGGGNQAGGGGHHATYHQHGALMQQSPARIAKEHGMAGAYVNKPYAAPTTAVGYQATQPSMTAAQMYPTPYRQRTWSTTSSADSFIASYPILPIQSPYTVPYVAFAMMPPGATGGGTESLQHMVKSGGAQSDVTTYNSPAGVGVPATGLSTGGTAIPGIVPSTPPMTPMGYDWSAMMHMRTPTGPEQLLFGASSPPMIPSYYYPMQSISATTADTATVMSNDAPTPVNMAGTSPIYVPFVSFPPVSTYTTQPQ